MFWAAAQALKLAPVSVSVPLRPTCTIQQLDKTFTSGPAWLSDPLLRVTVQTRFYYNPSASPDTLVMIGPVNIFRLQSIEANGKHTTCWITWPSAVKGFRIITMECPPGPPYILSISKTEEKRRLAADLITPIYMKEKTYKFYLQVNV